MFMLVAGCVCLVVGFVGGVLFQKKNGEKVDAVTDALKK